MTEKNINVYFMPGLAANPNCFKHIKVPPGYNKICLDWISPIKGEPIEKYSRRLAEKNIDISTPFILVGYSFGGCIVQEMNEFLKPEKTILIASFKSKKQRPKYFGILRFINIEKLIPNFFYQEKGINFYIKFRSLFIKKNKDRYTVKIREYIDHFNPLYMSWGLRTVLRWSPRFEIENLYQICATKDIIFPYKRIFKNSDKQKIFVVDNATHLIVLERPKQVNMILEKILNS